MLNAKSLPNDDFILISCSNSFSTLLSGTILGPSLSAESGSGWTSINRPSIPTAIAALESVETNSRWPPVEVPLPPGC